MAKHRFEKYKKLNIKVYELLDMETQFNLIQYKKNLERKEARKRRIENRQKRHSKNFKGN